MIRNEPELRVNDVTAVSVGKKKKKKKKKKHVLDSMQTLDAQSVADRVLKAPAQQI
jgi:hypothetical protein